MAATKAAEATPAAAEATVTTSTAGGVTMSKSVGRSRSGPEVIRNDATGLDLGRVIAVGLGRCCRARSSLGQHCQVGSRPGCSNGPGPKWTMQPVGAITAWCRLASWI
jgi:hypothetical protein